MLLSDLFKLLTVRVQIYLLHLILRSATCGRTPLNQSSARPL